MAQKTDIRLRRSNTANAIPTHSNLSDGEMAMNTADGALYFKKSDDTIITAHDDTILHIDSSNGRIGINAPTPGYKLDVGGSVRFSGSASLVGTLQSYSGAFNIKNIATDQDINLQVNDNGTNTTGLTVQGTTAKVGIGTTSPSSALDIKYDQGNLLNLYRPNSSTSAASLLDFSFNTVNATEAVYARIRADVETNTNSGQGGDLSFHTANSGSVAEKMRITQEGNVGIGTSSPSDGLELSHTNPKIRLRESDVTNGFADLLYNSTRLRIRSRNNDTNGGIAFEGSNGSSVSEYARFTNVGNLGIGTTSPSAKLDVTGNFVVDHGNWTSSDVVNISTDQFDAGATFQTGEFVLFGDHDGSANKMLSLKRAGTDVFMVDRSGNVGIGTSSPSEILTLDDTDPKLALRDAGTERAFLQVDSSNNFVINNKSISSMIFETSDTERMRLSSTGNVGIGTTSPSQLLHVEGNVRLADAASIQFGSSFYQTITGQSGSNDLLYRTYQDHVFKTGTGPSSNTDGTTRMVIDVNGNVGIGTTTPNRKLEIENTAGNGEVAISGTTGADLYFKPTTSYSAGGNFGIKVDGGTSAPFLSTMEFSGYNNGVNAIMTLKGDGKVGIGTTSPSDLLHVEGNFRVQNGYINLRSSYPRIYLTDTGDNPDYQILNDNGVFSILDGTNSVHRLRVASTGITFNNAYTFPTADGTAGQVLKTDGSGNLTFQNDSGGSGSSSSITDADGDTKIQVEENSDDDAIRFDVAGSQKMILTSAGRLGVNDSSPQGVLHVTSDSTSVDALYIESNEASSSAAPVVTLHRHSASPADADYLGQLKFKGENDADQEVVYAKITAKIQDASDGSEDGLIEFANRKAGSNAITARLRSDSLQLLNGTGLTVAGDTTISGNLTVNGTTTTLNTATLDVEDLNITVAKGSANSAAANGAGLTVDCGSDTDTTFTYNGSSGQWETNTELVIKPRHTGGTPPTLTLTDLNNQYQAGIVSSGHLTMRASGSGNLYWQNGGTYLMTLANDGNLAIGNAATTVANARVFIKTSVDDSVTQGLVIERSANTDRGYINYQGGAFQIRSTVGDPINLGETDAVHMRINPDGKVGIGTTSPTYNLDVTGGATASSAIRVDGGHASLLMDRASSSYDSNLSFLTNGSTKWRIWNNGSDNTLSVRDEANAANVMTWETGGNVGINKIDPAARFQVEEYGIDTTTTSTSATTEVAVASLVATQFRSARFTIQITNSTDSTYHTTELLALHDGTTANITEFGTIFTGTASEATFDADINSGNFRLLATPASTDAMVFKVISHSITV